jgi:hypothetical protein
LAFWFAEREAKDKNNRAANLTSRQDSLGCQCVSTKDERYDESDDYTGNAADESNLDANAVDANEPRLAFGVPPWP